MTKSGAATCRIADQSFLRGHEQAAVAALRDAAGDKRVALAFSGGKDSLACLELAKIAGVRPILLHANPGARLPHMGEYIRVAAEGYELVELRTDQAAYWKANGIPANVVPMFNHRTGLLTNRGAPRPLIVDWLSCRFALIAAPLWAAAQASGAGLVIHGQRDDDGLAGRGSPNGIPTHAPLWDWTEEQVYAFLDRRGVTLPSQYQHGVGSMECANCPALTTPKHMRYLKKAYPEIAAEMAEMLRITNAAVTVEMERSVWPVLAAWGESPESTTDLVPLTEPRRSA